jgi:hypothetical protein
MRNPARPKPWLAWTWTVFAVITIAIAIARPSTGQTFLAAMFVAGAGMMWNNVRRG